MSDHGLFAPVAAAAGFRDDDEAAKRTPGWVEDQIAKAEQIAPDLPLPIGGGWDNLHLHHVLSAVEEPPSDPRLLVEDRNRQRGALIFETMTGWWRGLHTDPRLLALEHESGSAWEVEVLIRTVGSLGTYRRSPNTGIRHATTENVHTIRVEPL